MAASGISAAAIERHPHTEEQASWAPSAELSAFLISKLQPRGTQKSAKLAKTRESREINALRTLYASLALRLKKPPHGDDGGH